MADPQQIRNAAVARITEAGTCPKDDTRVLFYSLEEPTATSTTVNHYSLRLRKGASVEIDNTTQRLKLILLGNSTVLMRVPPVPTGKDPDSLNRLTTAIGNLLVFSDANNSGKRDDSRETSFNTESVELYERFLQVVDGILKSPPAKTACEKTLTR